MMDKTININIAGTLFQIDEVAYSILRDYLQAINSRFKNVQGGHETIDDIESRIAEIFQSQKGLAGVITKENVEAMISIIGKPEDFELNEIEVLTPVHAPQRKRMYRNPEDSIISGVCGGIGAYLNTDPVLFRILFVLFTLFFGIGFFVYIALWIALPSARTDTQKKEMYGNANNTSNLSNRQPAGNNATSIPSYNKGYYNDSKIGNAFNEIFRAIGRVCYIALRILLIMIGIALVLTGFLAILGFVMIFAFKYSGAFSSEEFVMNLRYFPDFLNYIVDPSVTKWIIALTLITLILPMLALIYWGVKMIFWFKAKDGVFSLAVFVLWVLNITALAMVLFSEGISFAETGKTSIQNILHNPPDTLFIITDRKVGDLKFDKKFSLPDKEYTLYINEGKKELYIVPSIDINNTDNDILRIDVRKRSSGLTKSAATIKSQELLYNFTLNHDTLRLDEYFTIPSGRKWSADYVGIDLNLPAGTIMKFDSPSENLFRYPFSFKDEDYADRNRRKSDGKLWIMTEDGIKPVVNKSKSDK